VHPLHIVYINGPDIERLALSNAEILDAVEAGLDAQGRKEVVIEPRVHLVPQDSSIGHFNVLRGYIRPLEMAGVKAGVEIYLDHDVAEISEDCPVLEAALDGHDKLVTFVWRHLGEGGTALVLAAALAKLGDVVIYEPSEDVIFSPERSAQEGMEFLEEAKKNGEFSGSE